jgi:hypothetical protein
MEDTIRKFTSPERLYERSEILGKSSRVPNEPGLYGWYFRDVPDLDSQVEGFYYVYVACSAKQACSTRGAVSKHALEG